MQGNSFRFVHKMSCTLVMLPRIFSVSLRCSRCTTATGLPRLPCSLACHWTNIFAQTVASLSESALRDCRRTTWRTLPSASLRRPPASPPVDFDPFRNSLVPASTNLHTPTSAKRPAYQPLYPRRRPRASFQLENAQEVVHQAIDFLRLRHEESVAASNVFPSDISPSCIRESVARYEEVLATASKRSACCSYGRAGLCYRHLPDCQP